MRIYFYQSRIICHRITSAKIIKLKKSDQIRNQFKFPIKFLGIGEGIEDLKVFDKKAFVESLFKLEDIEK